MKRHIGGVLAVLALFVALGGSALAARHYLITNTHQIKPSVLRALKGKVGPPGPAGAPGPAGPSNLSALVSVDGPVIELAPSSVGGQEVTCPAGGHAISGGGDGSIAGIGASEMNTAHTGWFIVVTNLTSATIHIHAEAECANAGSAVAASVTHGHSMRQVIAEQTAELAASRR